jgi:hypothetical protein
MDTQEAQELLKSSIGNEEPVFLPPGVLKDLSVNDVPEGVEVEVGVEKDGIRHIDWDGVLYADNGRLKAEARYTWYRKYWYQPLGLQYYLDLIRRAIEVRSAHRVDVQLQDYSDDGASINLTYSIDVPETNLGKAYDYVTKLMAEIEEVAEQASEEVGKMAADIAQRISGWGTLPLDKLVEAIEAAKSTDEKGRTLEELMSRLFESISGFSISGRIRTATEEIDIMILNDSSDPRFRRESAILLAECKNWSGKCGKDEFVIFREKIENRNKRCSLGFLISWNGFTGTISKEMLRGSREETLIVPLTGKDIRHAVINNNFDEVLFDAWERAVTL